jgi:hypothetical protein
VAIRVWDFYLFNSFALYISLSSDISLYDFVPKRRMEADSEHNLPLEIQKEIFSLLGPSSTILKYGSPLK